MPRFLRHLRNVRCCDGDAVTLEAHVEAPPEPMILWEKDGRIIPSGRDFRMAYDGVKATFSVPRIYPEDKGEYTCVAKNSLGRALSSACIIVDIPEEKENLLQKQLRRPENLLSPSSTPQSTPRSTPVRTFSPLRRFSTRSSVYEGSVSHIRGGPASDDTLIMAPKFFSIPHNRVVEEGDSVRLQCVISGHPMPWSTWDKDGLIVTPTTRTVIREVDDLRALMIDDIRFEDAGLYRITLENDYGRIEATARLDVICSSRHTRSSTGKSIRASSAKRNAYLHRRIMGPSTAIGGRMALATTFRGSSMPTCKFFHNGVELQPSKHVSICSDRERAELVIENVSVNEEGIYTCIITDVANDPITTSTVVHFRDSAFPQEQLKAELIKPLPRSLMAYEGSIVDLCFEIDINQPFSYFWSKNDERIEISEDFKLVGRGRETGRTGLQSLNDFVIVIVLSFPQLH